MRGEVLGEEEGWWLGHLCGGVCYGAYRPILNDASRSLMKERFSTWRGLLSLEIVEEGEDREEIQCCDTWVYYTPALQWMTLTSSAATFEVGDSQTRKPSRNILRSCQLQNYIRRSQRPHTSKIIARKGNVIASPAAF